MVQNYATVTNALEQFASAHLSLRRFKCSFFDQIDNFSTSGNSFPILYAVPNNVDFNENINTMSFRVYCVDALQKDRSNEGSILNETLLILRDLTNWIKDNVNNNLNLLNEPRVYPVNSFLVDFTTGWYMDIDLETETDINECVIPFSYNFQFSGVTCDLTYVSQYLTCQTVTACTILQNYILNVVNSHSGSTQTPTFIQNGLNTYTGGTIYNPTVNVSGGTFSNGYFTTLSGGTLYSGSTNLYDIFLTTADGNDITRVQPGANITTGGTFTNPIINLIASPSINNLTVSGTNNNNSLSATTFSAGTINSGSTNLYNIFSTTDTVTRVQPGSNITTGGTANNPTVNLVASPSINGLTISGTANVNIISATTLSAGTMISGTTNLYNIFSVRDIYSTGLTYNITTGVLTEANSTGGTITAIIPTIVSAAYSAGTITLVNSTGGTVPITGNLGYTLYANHGNLSPADGVTYFYGSQFSAVPGGAGIRNILVPKSGTVKSVYVTSSVAGTLGSSETVQFLLRLNNTTDTTITTTAVLTATTQTYSNTSLNLQVVAGDFLEMKMISPTWATNPTNITQTAVIYIE